MALMVTRPLTAFRPVSNANTSTDTTGLVALTTSETGIHADLPPTVVSVPDGIDVP